MRILLVGQQSVVTETIYQMLISKEGWQVTLLPSWYSLDHQLVSEINKKASYDLVIANLADYSDPALKIIGHLVSQFTTLPLLALNFYQRRLLIDPLLKGGAMGYVQIGISEDNLFNAICRLSNGEQYIATENT